MGEVSAAKGEANRILQNTLLVGGSVRPKLLHAVDGFGEEVEQFFLARGEHGGGLEGEVPGPDDGRYPRRHGPVFVECHEVHAEGLGGLGGLFELEKGGCALYEWPGIFGPKRGAGLAMGRGCIIDFCGNKALYEWHIYWYHPYVYAFEE